MAGGSNNGRQWRPAVTDGSGRQWETMVDYGKQWWPAMTATTTMTNGVGQWW